MSTSASERDPLNPFSFIPDRAMLPVAIGLVFLFLLVVGFVIFAPLIDYARHRRRVAQVEQFAIPGATPAPRVLERSPLLHAALVMSSVFVRSDETENAIADRLDRAGLRLRPTEWVLFRILACVFGIVLFVMLVGPGFGLVIGFLVGFAGMAMFRRIRTERRYQAFAGRLPDALQLVVGSLRAGFSLGQAIEAMIRESPDPVGTEFSRALATTRLGADLDDALARLAVRMRSRDLEWVVIAIRIQREVGGNLAEVVNTNVEAMREREGLRRHVRSLSAEGRLSAYILCGLPPAAVVMMLALRREYILPLFTTAAGLAMLVTAGILVALGSFWMWRMVQVEV